MVYLCWEYNLFCGQLKHFQLYKLPLLKTFGHSSIQCWKTCKIWLSLSWDKFTENQYWLNTKLSMLLLIKKWLYLP